jgi:hypothetical protein
MPTHRSNLWLISTFVLTLGIGCGGDGDDKPAGDDDAGATGGTGGMGGMGGSGTGGTGGLGGTGGTGGTQQTGGTGGTEQTGGTGGTGGVSDAGPDVEPDVTKPSTCDHDGFVATETRVELVVESSGDDIWAYTGSTGETSPFEVLRVEVWESYGAPLVPGTYTLGKDETSYKTCAVCLILNTDCSKASQQTKCNKTFMPFEGSTYTIHSLGGVGDTFKITLDDVAFREVTIDDKFVTTPVAGGSTWCMADAETSSQIVTPGFVDLPDPTGLSCDYPDPPYHFMGPEDGKVTPEPGTVPPMSWPGAFFGDEAVGFDLAQYKCDNPDIKTLFIIVGAGWCSACKSFMEQSVCKVGGLEDQLHARNAEILYVWGDSYTPGTTATNSYANTRVNAYGCKGGYRIADIDNSAGFRVIYSSPMFDAIPWAAAIRMEDMKLTHEQSETSTKWMDFVGIAEANNQ